MNEYIKKYQDLCFDLNNGISKADIRRHNNAMKKLSEMYYQLCDIDDKSFIYSLLNQQNIQVKFIVATHCLGWGIYLKEAKKVLKQITKNRDEPELAFNAEVTLSIYKEQGYLII